MKFMSSLKGCTTDTTTDSGIRCVSFKKFSYYTSGLVPSSLSIFYAL